MPASTLIIGIGGQGGRVVERIAKMTSLAQSEHVEFMVMDTDVNDLERLHSLDARIHVVQTSYRSTVGGALEANSAARERWFPTASGIVRKSLTEGAGQVRAISRLAFDHAIANGKMAELEECIARLRALRGDPHEQAMRVMICGSIAGGTGSGIALPLALYIRYFLRTRYQDNSTIIRGFFLEPDCLFKTLTDEGERNILRRNSYAAIREIDAFIRKHHAEDDDSDYRHVVFNAPQPGYGERIDYPNLLPYDYIFLMDALNVDGEHLHGIDDYLDHMSDIIRTQTIGTTAAKLNQQEDNVMLRLDETRGRARYAGAGCSHLVYPYEEIRRYFGLRWSAASISSEWLELDKRYREELKEGMIIDSPKSRAESFVGTFDILREQSDVFDLLGHDAVLSVTERDREGNQVIREKKIGEDYKESLTLFGVKWSKEGLVQESTRLKDIEQQHLDANVPSTSSTVKSFSERIGAGWQDRLLDRYVRFERKNRDYFEVVTGDEPKLTRLFASRLFKIRESVENPLTVMNEPQYVEHYLTKLEGAGAKHPLVVRYILYSCLLNLNEAIDTYASECEGDKRIIKDKIDEFLKDDKERRAELVSPVDDGVLQKLKTHFKIGGSDEDALGSMSRLGHQVLSTRDDISRLRDNIAILEVFRAAKEHVEQLISAYEGFFSYLEGQVPVLNAAAEDIELRSDFNQVAGSPTRYVCASRDCITELYNECPQNGSSANLPPELCADIFRGVARYIALTSEAKTQRERNRSGRDAFEKLFKEAFVGFWTLRLEDPAHGYQSVLDKSVLRAVIDEASYRMPTYIHGQEEVDRYLRGYLHDVILEAYDLAKPYMQLPHEGLLRSEPSHKGSCIYTSGVLEGLGAFTRSARDYLQDVKGVEVVDDEVSVHELLFSRAIYGFTADQLPMYACEFNGQVHYPEGEYHQAYWNVASSLSPDTSRNALPTPHIDRHWHLISYLPDISEEYQQKLRKKCLRAFLYGLIGSEFRAERVRGGEQIFHLASTRDAKQIKLMASDGSDCNRFYEIFDALKFDPQVVAELNRRADMSLDADLRKWATPRVQSSYLVRDIESHAFDVQSKFVTLEAIIDILRGYRKDTNSLLGLCAMDESTQHQFMEHCGQHFFNRTNDERVPEDSLFAIRHSVFEIPLYYSLSLPPSEAHAGEFEEMIEDMCQVIRDYLANYSSSGDLDSFCDDFFKEQYLLFERNLVYADVAFPDCALGSVVSLIREKALACFDGYSGTGQEVKEAQAAIISMWNGVIDAKDAALRASHNG